MTRNVLAQARREDALRARFQGAVAQEGRSAATVLRQLMQAYVLMQECMRPGGDAERAGMVRCAAASVLAPEPRHAVVLVRADMEREARERLGCEWFGSHSKVR